MHNDSVLITVGGNWSERVRATRLENAMTHDDDLGGPKPPLIFCGVFRRKVLARLMLLGTVVIIITTFGRGFRALGQSLGVPLKQGDIIYADSGDAIEGGFIIKVDPDTGAQSVISSGGYLQMPFEPVIDATGQIVVSDSGRLLRINPATGAQTILADNGSGLLGVPYGLAVNRYGNILAANVQAVLLVDAVNGQIGIVSAGGNLFHPLAVAVAKNGQIFAVNIGLNRQIIRINPQTGAQWVICEGGLLKNPQAIAVQGNDLYITDVATSDGNFGIGRVIHVDAQNGTQTVISEGANLVGPVGIAVDANGQLIVGDPYTINPASPDIADGGYDGGIIRIDPATGAQQLLARGRGSFVNPRGVAVVPNLGLTQKGP